MLSRVPDSAALIRVQSWSRNAQRPEAIERLFELDWPTQAGQVARGGLDVVCIGPTDWLLLSRSEVDPAPLLRAVEEALRGSAYRATDFSSALVRIRINGAAGPALIAKVCALDLDAPSFAPGRAPRTLIAGIPVVVRRLEPAMFECLAPLSYAEYLLSWLTDASAEFTAAVTKEGFASQA